MSSPAPEIDRAPASLAGAEPTSMAGEFLAPALHPRRISIAFVVLMVATGGLVVRAFTLQVLQGSVLRSAAERNRTRAEILVPSRAAIVDRNGIPLVENELRHAIGAVPADFSEDPTERAAMLNRIASALDLTADAVTVAIAPYPRTITDAVILREDLAFPDAIRRFVELADVPAVRLLVAERRVPRVVAGRELEGLSHVLGYVGRLSPTELASATVSRYRPSDVAGKVGIEASAEGILRGSTGLRTVTVDARGRPVGVPVVEPPTAGNPIALTIDVALQAVAERALRNGIRSVGARRGAAVVLDPDHGDVLALVSFPGFSAIAFDRGITPAAFSALLGDPDHPLFPRAIAGGYPSGSTIKPFIAAAALRAGVITRATRILSTGGIRVGSSWFGDWQVGGHGAVDVRRAIADSVNTFFYVVGGGWPDGGARGRVGGTTPLGPDGIATALQAFGFGRPTGVELPGEIAGLVPTPTWKEEHRGAPWYIGDTYHLAIGQGDLVVTPFQLARATAAIANGGHIIAPRVILGTIASTGTIVPRPATAATALDARYRETLAVVASGMRLAVTDGSARTLGDLPFVAAGKTGTAQVDRVRRPHAWFTGYAELPAANFQPRVSRRVVVTVLIEEGGEGSRVAVPVAKEIFAAWARS